MIIRFRSKDGNFRVNAPDSASLAAVLADSDAQLPPHGPISSSATPASKGEQVNDKWQSSVTELGIKHGDMFFVSYGAENGIQSGQSSGADGGKPPPRGGFLGDELDQHLSAVSGRINRPQTPSCTHGPKGMCEYCQPLEPWDEEYQQSHGIKHSSFHAWRKKMLEEGAMLEEPEYKVKTPCSQGHAPWPQAFCSKCQPPTITLQRQKFRMVDHVEFVTPKIVEQFIEFWRQTNSQRIGFLVGKYSSYEDHVPLGIKAEVHAIWEPQQSDDVDSLLAQESPYANVQSAANSLGLEIVGVIFTDSTDVGDGSGKVVTKRHSNSYFLSSLEVQFASRLQNQYPHYLASSDNAPGKSSGPLKSNAPLKFSSRFVTCVVSGNEFGDIDVACYQASTQAEALVRADLVVPSTNPSLMRIQQPSPTRYVPDIMYRRINEYKSTVTEDAKPAFPLEYLLVSLSHGFKTTEETTTIGDMMAGNSAQNASSIENRPQIRGQTPSQLADSLEISSAQGVNVSKSLDFHALLYLSNSGVSQVEDQNSLVQLVQESTKGAPEGRVTDLASQFASSPGMNTLRMSAS